MNIKLVYVLTTVETGVRTVSNAILAKIIAVTAGPSALAVLGQFQNVSTLFSSIASGSIQTGVITHISKSEIAAHQVSVFATALVLTSTLSLICLVPIIFLQDLMAQLLVFDNSKTWLALLFAVSLFAWGYRIVAIAALNGLKRFYGLLTVGCLTSIVPLIITIIYFSSLEIDTVLIALIAGQISGAVVGLVLVFLCFPDHRFTEVLFAIDWSLVVRLLGFGVVTLLGGLIVSSMLIIARVEIIQTGSVDEAGIWEAAYKIGVYFKLLVYTPLSVFYLPKLSSMSDLKALIGITNSILIRILVPMSVVILIVIGVSSRLVPLLYSDEFGPVSNYLVPILIAEALRVCGGVYVLGLWAQRKLVEIVVVDLACLACFVILLNWLAAWEDSVQIVAFAYLISSLIYLGISWLLMRTNIIGVRPYRFCD